MEQMQGNRADLEYQYSPSRWSKRFGPEEVIQCHAAAAAAGSRTARESIPFETLRYGKGENQLLDLFGTSLPNDSPILVHVHGGYWQDLDRSISAYVVEPLFRKGIRVAVVGYDLAPNGSFDILTANFPFNYEPVNNPFTEELTLGRIMEEMGELRDFLKSWCNARECKKIWFSGHSAGAHLIATLSKNPGISSFKQVRGMIFISGIYDLVPLLNTSVNDNLRLTREEAQRCSIREIPVKELTGMKFLIAVAENDSDEFRRQSKEFHGMLKEGNLSAEYMLIKEMDHFDVVEKLNEDEYELTMKIIDLISNE